MESAGTIATSVPSVYLRYIQCIITISVRRASVSYPHTGSFLLTALLQDTTPHASVHVKLNSFGRLPLQPFSLGSL